MIAAASAVSRFGGSNFGHNAHRGAVASHSSGPTSDDVHAEVTHYVSDVRPDGFDYAYDTTNAIHDAASGNEHGDIQGDFSWVSPEGVHVALQYVADENGYQPNSDVLPTPPPIPAAILRSLEYIRTHPYIEEGAQQSFGRSSNKNYGRRF